MKYSIFHIEGGIGKHIAATAVAKAIKKRHPDRQLIVVCAWPDVFVNAPYVDRVYRFGYMPYFYQDYIEGKDSILFHNNPYFTTDHIHKRKRLVESWCGLYGLDYDNETPDLLFNKQQIEANERLWNRGVPVMVIHTHGGEMRPDAKPYCWTRDMPIEVAQSLVDHYRGQYHIIQVTKANSPKLTGAEHVLSTPEKAYGLMEFLSIAMYSNKRILIDSSLQHATAALGKKSTVLWLGTSPKVFGYEMHDNICADIPNFKLPNSYLFDFDFHGHEIEYPFGMEAPKFDIDAIIKSVDAQ